MRRRDFFKVAIGSGIDWPLLAGAPEASVPVIGFLVGAAGASPVATQAQQVSGAKLYRIGFISLSGGPNATDKGFQKGLRDLGYLEGQNVVFVFRWASGNQQQLSELVSELLSLRMDVI